MQKRNQNAREQLFSAQILIGNDLLERTVKTPNLKTKSIRKSRSTIRSNKFVAQKFRLDILYSIENESVFIHEFNPSVLFSFQTNS